MLVGAETLELLLPNGTYQVIDAFVCYNHTYRYAACFDTDACLLTVPFTGSGITVYVNQAGPVGINASITVDGANAQTNVLNAPPAPAYQIANVSMFDVQRLPSGSHTLKLLINDLFGSYTGMMFDYAFVNETLVANTTLTTTTTSSASMTATSISASTSSPARSSSAPHTDISAIVGGVIGVLAVVILGALAFFWMRRRRGHGHVPEMIDLHSHSASPPFDPHARYDPGTSRYDPYVGYTRSTANAPDMPLVPNRLVSSTIQPSPSSPSSGRDTVTPFTATSSSSNASGTRSKTGLVVSNDTANVESQTGLHVPSTDTRRSDVSPLLTDEQADFINSLHQNNVPAAAIARVLERMLADRHAGIQEWERETRLARTFSMSTAPPSYDLIAERG
ncbi:hypothetical protein JVT61DRAFT_11620 [Boletus reticuloceps]|uniref:Uncharacterized protein n=1 Tax=Boletus reticuloceps TaxID=495285 RepID=A0A8I3ABF8_9AGAM|nr:hypothetical protein JVT61DRAFT_11620 [Boletus reticuloceps]